MYCAIRYEIYTEILPYMYTWHIIDHLPVKIHSSLVGCIMYYNNYLM